MKNNGKLYNELILTRDAWGDELWHKVGEQLDLLTREGNICVVYNDDVSVGVVIIQYEHDDQHSGDGWGCANPYWLTPDDLDTLYEDDNNEYDG